MANSVITDCCLHLQQNMDTISQDAIRGIWPNRVEMSSFGALRALQESRTGGINNLIERNGKERLTGDSRRTVQLKYAKQGCYDAVPCEGELDCSPAAESEQLYGYCDVVVDCCVQAKPIHVSVKKYKNRCESIQTELAMHLREAARTIAHGMNRQIACKIAEGVGNYWTKFGQTPVSSFTDPTQLNIFTGTAPSKPQPMGLFPLHQQYQKMGVGDRRIFGLSGSDFASKYLFAADLFSRNEDGFNTTLGMPFNPMMDWCIDSELDAKGIAGCNRLITWVEGSIDMLEWWNYEGDCVVNGANGRPSFFDPVTATADVMKVKFDIGTPYFGFPIVVDMLVKYDSCEDTITIKMKKHFDVWKLPQDAFSEACDQYHNYCLLWSLGCGDDLCEPCTPAPAPAPIKKAAAAKATTKPTAKK